MAAVIPTLSAVVGLSANSSLHNLSSTTESVFHISSGSPTDYNNYDNYEDGICHYEPHGTTILPVLYAIFFILGIVGNCLVIWVIVCGVRLRSMTDVCLLNLAVSDLLLVCSLPFLAHQARDQWLFGEHMCKVVLGIYHIAFYCGIFFINLMSIDRYLAIVHVFNTVRARTRSFGMIAAAVTWLAGFLASFPELIYLKLQPGSNNTKQFCYPDYPSSSSDDSSPIIYHFWTLFIIFKMNILGLFVPIVIMGFCYSQIIWNLLYSPSSKKQTIRLLLIVVAAFFCCWVPYNVASFFKALELLHVYTECESSKAIRLALQVTEAVAYSHCCLNPVLYAFLGKKFRRHLVRLVSRTPCGPCQVIKLYLPQDRING